MKSTKTMKLSLFALLSVVGICLTLPAQETLNVERVFLKGGILFIVQEGKSLSTTNQVILPNEIAVQTNGIFRVKNGKKRPLLEGQALGMDGMLTSPDGTVRPVFDHIAFLKGQPVVIKDGDISILQDEVDLPGGQRVTADGYLYAKSGMRRKLLDGEIIDMGGKEIRANDTITLKEGKVMVQKDGTLLEVQPGRSVMMNDGTKVFGDGTFVTRDGTKKNLAQGEIVVVDGVAPKNP